MFLKIFLWFWLAIALLVGVLVSITAATANTSEPAVRIWRVVATEAMNIYAASAAETFDRGGQAAVQQQLAEIARTSNFRLAVFDANFNELAANAELPDARRFAEKAAADDDIVLDINQTEAFAARKIVTPHDQTLILVGQVLRPRSAAASAANDQQTLILRIIGVVLAAGLVCYGLARYLTSPLDALRQAAQTLANGDLSVRVADKIGRRGDEMSGLARDFDEMAARIENLIAAQKNLTTDISHELRSPLARLGVALEIARAKSNHEALPSLDRIERESNRLNEMIGQMLLLSKLEAGAQPIAAAPFNLSELIEEIAADADFEAQNKSVEIIRNDSCVVRGDHGLLRSAIENVVRNAVKHTPENASVTISLECSNGSAAITVRDFGAGVPNKDLDKLFRPFFRVDYARQRSAGGFGLGLAIAERAVTAHGGTVTAKNARDGNGLIVQIQVNYG